MNNMKKSKILLIIILIIIIFFIIKLLIPQDNLKTYIGQSQDMIESGMLNDGTIIYLKELDLNTTKYNKCNSDSFIIVYKDSYEKYIQCGEDSNFNFIDISEIGDINELNKFGVYTINNKTVAYSKYDKHKNIDDTLNYDYPTIKVNGLKNMDLYYGDNYQESGAYAFDYNTNLNLSDKVIIEGNVDNKKVGEYLIKYTVYNDSGYFSMDYRKVRVIKNNSNLNINVDYNRDNTKEVIININITGEGFKSLIDPDNKEIFETNYTYKVNKNGDYIFKVKDVNDELIEKEVKISNIDDTNPTGTCNATITNKSVVFTINPSEKISKYKYYVNNDSKEGTSNNYTFNGIYKIGSSYTTKVELTDNAGNVSTINCNLNNKLVRKIVNDKNGNQCLEGYTCYKQRDYRDAKLDKYQATSSGVGTISSSGCCPTSMTIAVDYFGKKDKSGNEYTPRTLINEVIYKDGKVWGYSNYDRVKYIVKELNLKVSEAYHKKDVELMKEHLRSGRPVVVNVAHGCYTGGAHYMVIIGINEKDQIFISDPYQYNTTSIKGGCTVNAWSSIDEMFSKGGVGYFALIYE